MASLTPFRKITHKQQVCSLYKRMLRNLESWYCYRPVFRFRAVLLRAEFDKNKCITDEVLAKKLLAEGEDELWRSQHYQPKKFTKSIGGNAYDREVHVPDWVLDAWHPYEKAQYPDYFLRREQRKKEYIELWEKHYGKPSPSAGHH